MTKELYLKQNFEISSIERSKETTANHEFIITLDGFDIRIRVSEEIKQIEAKTKFPISEELHEKIHSHLIVNAPYLAGRQEQIDRGIAMARQVLLKAIYQFVNIMEFVTGYIFLNDNLAQGNCFCSLDNEHWEDVKKRHISTSLTASWNTELGLNACEKKVIQNHIDKNIEPFLATHHLYKATKETDPRHQVINLAVALELGIKEYLVRKKTDAEIEVLIKDLPAPPTYKLYGEILECFSGEKSPVRRKIIQDIATERNNLVHSVIRPDTKNLSPHNIKNYFSATKIALFHLWLDLYPYDERVLITYKYLLKNNPSLIREDYSTLDTE